jgi:hypothetical protein
MAQDTETFNNELYDLLKVRGYKPVPLNSQNQRVGASQQADVMEFTFSKDGEDYGKAWISVDDASNLKIYFDDEQQDSSDTKTPGVDYDDTWTGLLKHLKSWAQRRQLSFELTNKDRLGDDMRQRDYYKMKEKLGEGYHSMGKKASYNDAVPNVKIILQHNRALEEGEQRYRNVSRIFLENQDGERFLAPTTKPGIARVYARHIAEGGVPNDDRWNHIKSVCEDYNKMAGFVRATRNKEFNESAQDLINEGTNHYSNLRETLHKLTGHRGYHAYFESWTPSLMEDEGDDFAINELFVQETVDPRIESVMPILSKLRKNVAEMSEVDSLAEWADSIISEKLEMDSTTKSMAVPADKMLEAPGAETLAHNQSTEKKNLKAFGLAEETGEEPAIGKGKNAYTVTAADGKKVTVLADHDWQAKQTAKNHWKLANDAGINVKQKEVPTAPNSSSSAEQTGGQGTAINKATSQAKDTKTSTDNQAEPTSTWGKIKQAVKQNWNVPGGDDSYGGAAKAIAGMLEGDVVSFKQKIEANHDEMNYSKDPKNRYYVIDHTMDKLVLTTNDEEEAKREAAEWAEYDDLETSVVDSTTGKRVIYFDGYGDAAEYLEDGDDDWMPDVDEFEQEEEIRNRKRGPANDVDENFISMAPQAVAEEELEENEFAGNFKTGPAGQWRNKGPKANKPATVGDLVGGESKEIDSELARIMEIAGIKPK